MGKSWELQAAQVLKCDDCEARITKEFTDFIRRQEEMASYGVLEDERQIEMATWGALVELDGFTEYRQSVPTLMGVRIGKTYMALFLSDTYYGDSNDILDAIESWDVEVKKLTRSQPTTIECPCCFKAHPISKAAIDVAIGLNMQRLIMALNCTEAITKLIQAERQREQEAREAATMTAYFCAYFDLPNPHKLWPLLEEAEKAEYGGGRSQTIITKAINGTRPDLVHQFNARSEKGALAAATRWYCKTRQAKSSDVFPNRPDNIHPFASYASMFYFNFSIVHLSVIRWSWPLYVPVNYRQQSSWYGWVRLVPPSGNYNGGILFLLPTDKKADFPELAWLWEFLNESDTN